MFEDLIESYKLLPTKEKRNKLLQEFKLLIAAFEQICEEQNVAVNSIKSREILDLDDGNESEDDYLEALFVYLEYLKEVVSTAFLGRE